MIDIIYELSGKRVTLDEVEDYRQRATLSASGRLIASAMRDVVCPECGTDCHVTILVGARDAIPDLTPLYSCHPSYAELVRLELAPVLRPTLGHK